MNENVLSLKINSFCIFFDGTGNENSVHDIVDRITEITQKSVFVKFLDLPKSDALRVI